MYLDLTLTWKQLIYNIGKVAYNEEHCFFSQILVGYMWRVVSEQQNDIK